MRYRCPSCHTVTPIDAGSTGFACTGCGLWLATSNDAWGHDDLPTEPAWDAWPMVGFDVETTGTDPLVDRIVSAAIVDTAPGGHLDEWLINPGIDIPAGAAAIHGITTERARDYGRHSVVALDEIARTLAHYWGQGRSIAIYNAQFDLTILSAELDRHGLPPLAIGTVIDPLVIWRAAERYRKGSKTMNDAIERFDIPQGRAHNAADDAWTAAALVAPVIALTELAEMTGADVMRAQAESHREWATNFSEWLSEQGGDISGIDRSWPLVRQPI